MKIHIIGCSGTGKTYLAKKLSNKYNIPHFDLDNIYWDNSSEKYGVKTEIEKRNKSLQNILEKDDWIIEGIYYKWLEQSFKNADIIYILDLPKYIYKFRIVKRFIKIIFFLSDFLLSSISIILVSLSCIVSFAFSLKYTTTS